MWGEIERLIIQKHLVMNQSAVLHRQFFSLAPFRCNSVGLTSAEGTLGLYFPLPHSLQLISEDVGDERI